MRHGDITNKQSPILAFNLDNLLFTNELENNNIINKIVNKFSSSKAKFLNRKVDEIFVRSLESLWNKYNYSIYLITSQEFTSDIEAKLTEHNVCYTRLMSYIDLDDLRTACHNQYTYYFDSDESIISYLSSPKAVHIKDIWMKVGKA